MEYYNICRENLQNIAKGDKNAEYYWENIKRNCIDTIDNCDEIVFCGTLAFVREFADYIADRKKCYFFDCCQSEGMFLKCPIISITDIKYKLKNKAIFIILSLSNLEFYQLIVRTLQPNAKILYYTAVEMAYVEYFQRKIREDYFGMGSVASLGHIVDNACDLLKILDSLSDDKSKEIFSRIIQFRLTENMEINEGIKSAYDDYLEADLIPFGDFEIVADLGGYVGDTLYEFDSYFKLNGINYQYHLFEPSKENYLLAKESFDAENVSFYNVCVGDQNRYVSLRSGSGLTVGISENDNDTQETEMIRLDDCLDEVTYVKMDIEGSEELALRGMKGLIHKCRPKLAVCIYHKYDDIVKLVKYVQELTFDLDYEYYVRAQRDSVVTEMVMYAIPHLQRS